YANSALVAHAEAVGKAGPTVIADATLPINLAVSGVTGARLLDLPLHVDVHGDSLPLNLISTFTDAVANIGGKAAGSFVMGGTLARPSFAGALSWANGTMKIVPTGMGVHDVAASGRRARDTVVCDSVGGISG